MDPDLPTVDAVVLTMNDRGPEMRAALASLQGQVGVRLRTVLVGNGCTPDWVPDGAVSVALETNLGIPQGRNVGAQALGGSPDAGEYLLFFDNDAVLPGPDTLVRLLAEFAAHPQAAYVQPRIVDPDSGVTLGRWVPRLRSSDAARAGTVTVMAEGIVLIRRSEFERAGEWPDFFMFHEGVDLAWRLWSRGRTGWYAAGVQVHHPATDPARHAPYYRLVARNRAWVALRRLPAPLVPVYLAVWTVLSTWRLRHSGQLMVWFRGMAEGLRGGYGKRDPMSWRTVVRLTLAGRPPIV
ncbi:glycosyltransferase family 2 protein [Streptacidiphilus sp. EB103A]|uniref:glycosyltransferase family 2 protein n=1 Tax=Streptacidiphilus sp. EB103A TaxID=3156275 RepID=UPI0035134C6E